MDRNTIIVTNWMALMLLVPAVIILSWKMVSYKLNGRRFSPDLTTALLLGLVAIEVIQLNIDTVSWISVALLAAQLLMLIVLYQRLWSPFLRKLRGEAD